MKFGPFTMAIARALTEELAANRIPFEVQDDQGLRDSEEKEWKASSALDVHQRRVSFDPAFLFVEISDELLKTPNATLERLGLVSSPFEPSFEGEEFVCSECGKVVAQAAGYCGIHKIPLVSWIEFKRAERERADQRFMRWVGVPLRFILPVVGIAFLVVLVATIFNLKLF